MTATTVTPEVLGKKVVRRRMWRCQFCVEGHHGSCPGAVRHTRQVAVAKDRFVTEPYLWFCKCEESGHPGLHCLDCKNEHPDEVDESTWTCLDRYVCAGILRKRQENSRVWQMLQAARSRSALARRAKRLHLEGLLGQIVPGDDAKIEQLEDQLGALTAAKQSKRQKAPSVPRPKTRACECCGEPTKGGRFLPGHDARLGSALVARVKSGDKKAYEELKARNWLKKLPINLRNGV